MIKKSLIILVTLFVTVFCCVSCSEKEETDFPLAGTTWESTNYNISASFTTSTITITAYGQTAQSNIKTTYNAGGIVEFNIVDLQINGVKFTSGSTLLKDETMILNAKSAGSFLLYKVD